MRKSNFVTGSVTLALSLFAGVVASQTLQQRDPGLWEIRMNQGSPLAAVMQSMEGMLEGMPPAQRKQMEQMMQQSGASLAEPTVIKQCVTPEMAARDFQSYSDDPDMDCTTTSQKMSGTEGEFAFTCQSDEGEWKGQGRIWDVSAKHYKSEMTMEGTVEGRPLKVDMSHDAKWVSSDCQGVKPVG